LDNQTKTNVGIGAGLLSALSTGLIPMIGWSAAPLILISAIIAVWYLWPLIKSVAEHLTVDNFFAILASVKLHLRARAIREWLIPCSARTEFANAPDVTRLQEANTELDRLVNEHDKLQKGLQAATKQHGHVGLSSSSVVMPEAPEITGARRLVFESHEKIAKAQIAVNVRKEHLANYLIAKLSNDELVAKGLPLIEGRAQQERIIPAPEWRVLKLDVLEATARAHGLSYVGVVIGKPKRK
jgi:hypothetical protein